MATITAGMVKELREATGAGMMECKKALTETDGNMDEAVEFLRKSGAMKAEKKASRIAAEGICMAVVSDDNKKAAVVEVNSETDFVAKNEKFQMYVKKVAEQALTSDTADLDEFMEQAWDGDASKKVKDVLVEQIAVIGEKLSIRRFKKIAAEDGCVVSYVHGGGRIAVLVEGKTDVVNDAIKEAMTNIAMQVAALNPKYVSEGEVDESFLNHEKEIIKAQIMNDPKESQKPEKVIEGMIQGRIKKELKEICLMDQVYVKAEDGKQTVAAYIAQTAKEQGADFSIKSIIRYETGEGMEKKEENFAEEVKKQMGM